MQEFLNGVYGEHSIPVSALTSSPELDTGKFEFPRRERTDMKKRHKRSRSSLPRSVLEVGSKGAGSLPGDGDQRADAG
jgi:hypothetical protein